MELVLILCAFLTFMAVSAAAFVAGICALIVYSWQRQLQLKLEDAPREIQRAISQVVQRYLDAQEKLEVDKARFGGATDASEDEDSWSRMRGYS